MKTACQLNTHIPAVYISYVSVGCVLENHANEEFHLPSECRTRMGGSSRLLLVFHDSVAMRRELLLEVWV